MCRRIGSDRLLLGESVQGACTRTKLVINKPPPALEAVLRGFATASWAASRASRLQPRRGSVRTTSVANAVPCFSCSLENRADLMEAYRQPLEASGKFRGTPQQRQSWRNNSPLHGASGLTTPGVAHVGAAIRSDAVAHSTEFPFSGLVQLAATAVQVRLGGVRQPQEHALGRRVGVPAAANRASCR